MTRAWAWATLVAGTIDIIYAALLTAINGRDPAGMLRFVASGPYPPATEMGLAGSILGLIVHFTLMAIMAAAFIVAARNWPRLLTDPISAGIAYGLVTYVVMNWIVVPLRFDVPLPPKAISVVSQLFAHIVLVGIPIALIVAKMLRPRAIVS
ncbi:MAG: DUF1440 domain-containing protein [Pseudomonadota bacterium]|nr:DUF1440 domain-containing protein [Pseudomonadota bacterium]